MKTGDNAGMFRRTRHGVCHRCGWTGPVAKVRRRDRRVLQTGSEFGRLCHECTDDLLHIRKASEPLRVTGQSQLKSGRHRRVA